MRKIKNAVFTDNKKLTVSMIVIAVIMLLMTFIDFGFAHEGGNFNVYFGINTTFTSALSIIPISWGVSVILLKKTKKDAFAKMPAYIFCSIVGILFILYFIAKGGDIIESLLVMMLVILAAYPFIIATLTIEGRVYNRVFATVFTSILIALTLLGGIVIGIIYKGINLLALFFPLMYVELLLIVLSFRLEKIVKNKDTEDESSII